MVKKEHIILKEPNVGDFVLYEKWNPVRKRLHTDVGVVGREYYGNGQFIIHGVPRPKDSILLVLTLDGYLEQQNLRNVSSSISALQSKFL